MFAVVGFAKVNEEEQNGLTIEAGEPGIDALCMENRQLPDNPQPFLNSSHTINDYKNYAREYLPKNVCETQLREFLGHFDENMEIQSRYETLGFVNELQGLERHYIKLRDKISFVPFVESLLKRINHFTSDNLLSNDEKIVLNYLHAATLTKLSSIKNRGNHAWTIDLLAYTEFVQNHIKRLRGAERDDAINEHRKKFEDALEIKIKMAQHFIKSQILPEIKRNFAVIDQNILALIDENTDHQTSIKEQELKNALIRQRIQYWCKILGPLVLCLGTAAAIVFASGALAGKFLQGKVVSLSSSTGNVI